MNPRSTVTAVDRSLNDPKAPPAGGTRATCVAEDLPSRRFFRRSRLRLTVHHWRQGGCMGDARVTRVGSSCSPRPAHRPWLTLIFPRAALTKPRCRRGPSTNSGWAPCGSPLLTRPMAATAFSMLLAAPRGYLIAHQLRQLSLWALDGAGPGLSGLIRMIPETGRRMPCSPLDS